MLNRILRSIMLLLATCALSQAVYANTAFTERHDVKAFIDRMVKKHHFKRKQLVSLMSTVKMRPVIIQKFRAPAEKKPWHTYQMLFVTEWRVREGVDFWNKYHTTLARAQKKYGVPAGIIVATIGVETKYGKHMGDHRVLDALSNLGFGDSPRAPYFRHELEEFLLLCREQHLDPKTLKGSYAGAIGQPQFMPSSYRHYAVNFSGNPRIDLLHDEADVIASVANYYKQHGWKTHQPVAIPATMKNNRYAVLDKQSSEADFLPVQLTKYGVISNNQFIPKHKTKMIELQGYFGKEYWVGFTNFDVIKRYNASDPYAMAVYQLSYYITMQREKS